jgi:hypothetical protein
MRKSWKLQGDHPGARLHQGVRLETSSSIPERGGLLVAPLRLEDRRENDRLLREPMRLLPIVNCFWAKMGTGEDLRPRAKWP